jgi:peptidoglycan/xylan/chitin deacetylase (PgdA/CDA1 family)
MSASLILHSGTLAVLTYHSLDDSGSVLSTSPRLFATQMRLLQEQQVSVIPLAAVECIWRGDTPPRRAVAITFDDGFHSVYEHALPVLRQYHFPATVFLVADYCGRTNAWPSQPSHILQRPLLSWSAIKEMTAASIRFGSHTRTHPDLTRVTERQVSEEVLGSKGAIEDAVGEPVDAFAYPYGIVSDPVKCLVQKHFSLACATTLDFVTATSDRFALERLDMYYLRHPLFLRRLFSPEMPAYVRSRRVIRAFRRRLLAWRNCSLSQGVGYE